MPSITPVILCGGSGTRLWPLSRKSFPKQFVPLIADKSLLQLTLERVQERPFDASELELAETSAGLRPALRDHLPAIGATAVAGLFIATGHYRHGVLLSPVTGRMLADAFEGHAPPSAFDPKRLLTPSAATGAA